MICMYNAVYLAVKRIKFCPLQNKWMELESNVLSETNQSLKDKYGIFFQCGTEIIFKT